MIAYQKERLENAICYLAKEHQKRTDKPLYQTFLYKYLAFLEFGSLADIGKPLFGLSFNALENGPVPMELYNQRHNYQTDSFKFIRLEEEKIIIVPLREPDLDYLSRYELDRMEELLNRFARHGITARQICRASHRIPAWKKAHKRQENGLIRYEDAFSDDLETKTEEALSPQENTFLLHRSLQQLNRRCG
jgi:uncharacterized phage-associated protein